jgi:hypothetical protein
MLTQFVCLRWDSSPTDQNYISNCVNNWNAFIYFLPIAIDSALGGSDALNWIPGCFSICANTTHSKRNFTVIDFLY